MPLPERTTTQDTTASAPLRSVLKMNGLGNDFVMVDARGRAVHLTGKTIRQIADRRAGPGCDQLIVLGPSSNGADVFMRIFNANGEEVEACGNGARCVAWVLMEEGQTHQCTIETQAGILDASRQGDRIIVDLNVPRFSWEQIPLSEAFADTRGIELQIGPAQNPTLKLPSVVNLGNPHAVFWVDDPYAIDLERIGPLVEGHPLFPQGTNVSLAKVVADGHIVARVFERGAGLTQACGTAAAAMGVCAARLRYTRREVTVSLPGGDLFVCWRASDDHVLLGGPVTYEGFVTLKAEHALSFAPDQGQQTEHSGRGLAKDP